jgi:two-component system, LytTR family, response regulator
VIRTLIVDDEPLAREGILVRLGGHRDIEIVGEAADGHAAVEKIEALKPDLVFLDVQMPGLDGFQVLERISRDILPMVVFVTAHDVHALRAFEIHAMDYLLKPFSAERFEESLRRAREELRKTEEFPERRRLAELVEALEAARAGLETGPRYASRIAVRDRDRIYLVPASEVIAVEAAGNYVQIVTRGGKYLLRSTLAEMERDLDPARFARIHRSTIVNADHVREIRSEPHGDCDVHLDGRFVYRMSRAYRKRLLPESVDQRDSTSR